MNELLPSEACAIAADKGWYPASHRWIDNVSPASPEGWGCCALGAVMLLQPSGWPEGSEHHRFRAQARDLDSLVRPGTQNRTLNAFDNFVDFWRYSKGDSAYCGTDIPEHFVREMGVDAGLHGPDVSMNEMEDAFAALSYTDVWRAASRMLKTRGC